VIAGASRGKERGFNDHLADGFAGMASLDHQLNVLAHGNQILGLQRSDVQDHVNFVGAIHNTGLSFKGFRFTKGRPKGKTNYCADHDGRIRQNTASQ
jgi:hypothetical protein